METKPMTVGDIRKTLAGYKDKDELVWKLSRTELLDKSKNELIDAIHILDIRLDNATNLIINLQEEIKDLNDPCTQERQSYERMSLREIYRLSSSD